METNLEISEDFQAKCVDRQYKLEYDGSLT